MLNKSVKSGSKMKRWESKAIIKGPDMFLERLEEFERNLP